MKKVLKIAHMLNSFLGFWTELEVKMLAIVCGMGRVQFDLV